MWVTAECQGPTFEDKKLRQRQNGRDVGKTRCNPGHRSGVCRHLYLASHGGGALPDGHTDVRVVDFCCKNCISNK